MGIQGGETILQTDINRLKPQLHPNAYLNDTIINSVLNLIHTASPHKATRDVVSTYTLYTLQQDNHTTQSLFRDTHMTSGTTPSPHNESKPSLNAKFLLFPTHANDNHWNLTVQINKPGVHKKIHFIDSSNQLNTIIRDLLTKHNIICENTK